MAKGSRRAQRARSVHPELDISRARGGFAVRHAAADGDWMVRQAAPGTKDYRCPGCAQVIPAGTATIVAWQAEPLIGADQALDDRRHWHPACWRARSHRR